MIPPPWHSTKEVTKLSAFWFHVHLSYQSPHFKGIIDVLNYTSPVKSKLLPKEFTGFIDCKSCNRTKIYRNTYQITAFGIYLIH